MPIPDFQTLMLPLLRTYTDGEIRPIGRVVDSLAREFKLSDEDLRQLLPSGRQATFRNPSPGPALIYPKPACSHPQNGRTLG